MICLIYRSERKQGAYLYLSHDKTLDDVPGELRNILGECVQVMELNLAQREKLASENIDTVRENLTTQGYHLQMPPKDMTGVIKFGV